MVVRFTVDEDRRFEEALRRARRQSSDLSPALELIADDWYESEKDTFSLSSKGPYKDLTEVYKREKSRSVGFIYPILKRSGALERSVTSDSASGAQKRVTKKNLEIGSSIPYVIFHQEGTSKMPARPLLFVEGPFAVGSQRGRVNRWVKILDDFLSQGAFE